MRDLIDKRNQLNKYSQRLRTLKFDTTVLSSNRKEEIINNNLKEENKINENNNNYDNDWNNNNENGGFELECPNCKIKNIVSGNEPEFICKNCNSNLLQ